MHNFINDIIAGLELHQTRNSFFIQGEHYTYQSLTEMVSGIGKAICKNTNACSQCIGIIEEDNIETYASVLATLITGNTYVILNPHNPDERNQTIINSTGIELVLSSGKIAHSIDSQCSNLIHTAGIISKEGLQTIRAEIEEKSLAYIIFTSGSTGTPKGVPISHKNLNAFYEAYSALGFQLSEQDRMLQMFDLCFDVSVVSTLYPLTLGACIYTVDQNSVKYTQVYELLEDEELTFATIAPSLLSYLQPYFEEIHLPQLKYLGLTAEASHWELLSQFIPCIPNAELINLYGPTEGTIYCSVYKVDPKDVCLYNGMLAIGTPFKNIDARILNEDLKECQKGEKGELHIAGNQLMRGYWQDTAKSKQVFVDINLHGVRTRYYKTGDICYTGDNNCIYYCGRKDYQVQIQGFRVELNEIEHAVRQFYSDGNNVVVTKTNDLGNQELHLFLEGYGKDHKELKQFLELKLPSYMCPKKIYDIEKLPLNTSGKVDRKQITTLIN